MHSVKGKTLLKQHLVQPGTQSSEGVRSALPPWRRNHSNRRRRVETNHKESVSQGAPRRHRHVLA